MVVTLRDYQREAKLMADGRYHCARLELSGKAPLTDITICYRDRVRRGHSFIVRLDSDNWMPKPLARHRDLMRKRRSKVPVSAAMARDKQRVSAGTELLTSIQRSKLDVF